MAFSFCYILAHYGLGLLNIKNQNSCFSLVGLLADNIHRESHLSLFQNNPPFSGNNLLTIFGHPSYALKSS